MMKESWHIYVCCLYLLPWCGQGGGRAARHLHDDQTLGVAPLLLEDGDSWVAAVALCQYYTVMMSYCHVVTRPRHEV